MREMIHCWGLCWTWERGLLAYWLSNHIFFPERSTQANEFCMEIMCTQKSKHESKYFSFLKMVFGWSNTKWFKVFEHWFWISSTWISEVSWIFVYLQPQSLPLGLQKRAVGQKRSIRKRPKNDLQRVSRDCSNFEFSDSILPAQFSKM